MFDLHSHVLPEIDDGAVDIGASVAIARAAAADGVRLMAATPHVRDDYPTTCEAMETSLSLLKKQLSKEGVGLELASGGELDIEFMRRLSVEELRRFGLAGNPEVLLLEFPYYGWPRSLDSIVLSLRRKGFSTILSHPERNAQVQSRPRQLDAAIAAGAILQITCQSLTGGAGRQAQQTAQRLIYAGSPCLLATDVHSPDGNRSPLSAARDFLHDDALAEWLTVRVPAAIVFGSPLPQRPAAQSQDRRSGGAWRRIKNLGASH